MVKRDIISKLKNPPKKYRPVPFWSWNERLNTEETQRQTVLMEHAGLGGYFMHARGGLQTEYMSDEWFDNIKVGVDEAEKHGMYAWAYDENGWPSGFGDGVINGLGIKFMQKYLRMEQGEAQTETTIVNACGKHFCYEVNPFYVDTLDKEVIREFITRIYEPYYERFGSRLTGFFTDEPQLSRSGIPWSFVLPETYEKEYTESLLEHLPELFLPEGNYKQTRLRFWRLVTKLFRDAFFKQVYEWCNERGLKLTGHLVLEDNMLCQLTTNGAVMPHYEYFHIPGMDWLGRDKTTPLIPLQLASVAHQTGKKQVLSETFALTGWNVSMEELKWLYEGQMVRGVNLLCPHLSAYSLRGIRKRDYPPSVFYQEPWWEQFRLFTDAMSRIGMLLTEGKTDFEALVIHPQSTAWALFDNSENRGLNGCDNALREAVEALEKKHIFFDFGDEIIMEEKAFVENGRLHIGEQGYKTVILPSHEVLLESTQKLLEKFRLSGGEVLTLEDVPENPLIDNPNIICTRRRFSDFDLYYFVNGTRKEQNAHIAGGTEIMEPLSGNMAAFDGNYCFPPMGSLVVFDDRKNKQTAKADRKPLLPLPLDDKWDIKGSSFNALALDYCAYWFDGEAVEAHGHINNIQGRACDLERPVNIVMEFTVVVQDIPEEIYLVCETPEIFKACVNGNELSKRDMGIYADSAFRKLDMEGNIRTGVNIIRLEVWFAQSEQTYKNIKNSGLFESEKNKLTYDMEIEAIYLVGKFGVVCNGKATKLGRDAVRMPERFEITAQPREVYLSNIEQQGFPFFAGEMTLMKEFDLTGTDYCIRFKKKSAGAVKICVNGEDAGVLLWRPYELDLSQYLKKGLNRVEIILYSGLRNLLGPHHLESGESYLVMPESFFKELSLWGGWVLKNDSWNDDYCLVNFGVE